MSDFYRTAAKADEPIESRTDRNRRVARENLDRLLPCTDEERRLWDAIVVAVANTAAAETKTAAHWADRIVAFRRERFGK